MKRKYMLGAICLSALLFIGCGEKEETVKNQITIPSYDAVNTACEVKRGDLDTGETIPLLLSPSETMEYFFGKSGLLIEKVYVLEGDKVTKGTLLAEADNEDIKMNLKQAEIDYASIMENITYYTSLLEAAQQKNVNKPEEEIHNLDQISRYQLKLAALGEESLTAQQKIEEWKSKLAKTQIYAGMDGYVEYVAEYGNGMTSDEKMPFIKLGTNSQVFSGKMKGKADMLPGDQIEIVIKEGTYAAEVVSIKEEDEETSFNVTVEEYVDLTGVTYAEFLWKEEHLENVLYVPTDAIVTIGGESYVYVYDEKGFPDPVKVTIGKRGSRYTSITEGVAEGELVELF